MVLNKTYISPLNEIILNPPNNFKMWPIAQHKLGKTGTQKNISLFQKRLSNSAVIHRIYTFGLVTRGGFLKPQTT